MDKKAGTYLGTVKDDKWWDLYTTAVADGEDEGQWWLDDEGFHFFRQSAAADRSGVDIPLDDIEQVELVRVFASRWSTAVPILKIAWTKDGLNLSSGFIVSSAAKEAESVKAELEKKIAGERPLKG